MLELTVNDGDQSVVLRFEHSLRSISKWEQNYKIAFQATPTKTSVQMIDYFQNMLLDGQDPELVYRLSPQQLDDLTKYINDPMTASSVPPSDSTKWMPEVVTSELVYYWMTALKINWEAQDWHFNRLMMLIQITNHKSQPEKKRSPAEALKDWRETNARNKKLLGTTG